MSLSREADVWDVPLHDPPPDVVDVDPSVTAPVIDPTDPIAPTADAVVLLRWPAEADLRGELATRHVPRLLVLDPDTPPPLVWDDLEDWIRDPADPVEVQSRLRVLTARAHRRGPVGPVIDADGIVRWAGRWVAVPPIEAKLLALLLDRPGEVVRREDLVAAAWPGQSEPTRTLDGRIKHLRRRLETIGVAIRTVRGIGFLVEVEGQG